jgi:hypothetical protein
VRTGTCGGTNLGGESETNGMDRELQLWVQELKDFNPARRAGRHGILTKR